MTELNNNRWLAADHEFATRVEISDVSGFFHKNLTIEPGTRAMILERGQSIGEVKPGEYTLAGITDRLKFWTKKSITAILTREGEMPLDLHCAGLATSEFLEVEVGVRLAVQIEDVALFQKNLLASRPALTLDDLTKIILPIVQQALWETIGRLSIKDLTGQQARTDLEICIGQALGTALVRNGLKFTQVQTLSVSHPEYDEHRRRTGVLYLQRLSIDYDQAAAELVADRLLNQIKQQEATNDLEVLAQQVAADRMEGDLAVRLRRIGIRKQIREAVQAAQFDEINSEAESEKFLLQRDKERLLRADEFATLQATLKNQTLDRDAARAQLLKKLQIEQSAELESVRADLNHAHQVQTRRHEIALAELNDSDESRQWKRQLEREIQSADHRRTEELKQANHDRIQAHQFAESGRDDEWAEVQHDLRVERIRREIEVDRAERGQRIEFLSIETHKTRELADVDIKRRQSELENEINQNATSNQMERLRQVQELNLAAARAHHELMIAGRRMDADIEAMKEDRVSERMIGRLNAMKGFDKYGMIAVADVAQASLLADVLKTEANQTGIVETARAQVAVARDSDARLTELRSQMSDQQRHQYEQMMAAMQQAMLNQSASFGQFGSVLENVTKNLAPQAPQSPTVVVAGGGGATAVPVGAASPSNPTHRTVMCAGCRADNQETDRFCRQCGKPL